MIKLEKNIMVTICRDLNFVKKKSCPLFISSYFFHTGIGAGNNMNVNIKKNETNQQLKFNDSTNNINIQIPTYKKYIIDETFCSYITKRKTFLNIMSYDIKIRQRDMLYKKSDGCNNAYLYSTKLKKLKYSDRINNYLNVNLFNNGNSYNKSISNNNENYLISKKSLFDILYKKYSLVYLFPDTKYIEEMNKYLDDFNKRKDNYNIKDNIFNDEKNIIFLKNKKKSIHIFYCYVSPYKFVLSSYFSKKIAKNLKINYFNDQNFFYIDSKLNTNDQNILLFQNHMNKLPSLLLVDNYCYIRYHIKGLFTNESSYYLFNAIMNI
ncbi:conserved Plasmodium protein, unknown function [Plasmodium berghei]|uniref:Thioredoxin-like protein n=2 Tax=Plasmodium berghei TaxID=5821 RepID=A0A509B162_PLABA|nr:conserved Plasmodium protein, unknown function [Plasmodium berghei ANKA]CXJ24776.1 conserved Plasmodium protein, unknown function [Plasmodium berghei]SCM26816.1 conserved Plasmodium protein, unknown function [Plasmodium berghei]SCN28653.1 conserved Plasmodium protein, unknown function [Plasmodium berghei]SCO62867.1 conserved Plasmodium protein, unknown function [Plasmodium berghei]SCO64401.1 conserved Plasmodium protein, unknown function [Plasmodium berghei]|eukprot:XP_034424297.1 conserved Plasmodium protein, unknown function [Plasmodium berghei ANKA]